MSAEERWVRRDLTVGIVGLGYVGLPLAMAFAQNGFTIIGVDLDAAKVARINKGDSYVLDVDSAELSALVRAGKVRAGTDYAALTATDAIFVCVPTPLGPTKTPDLSYVTSAVQGIAAHLQTGQLVVLQSSTFPGTTEELAQPMLEQSGLKAGRDFHLAFSPERINPGDKRFNAANTPKVVGGLTPACTAAAKALLENIGSPVYAVSSPRSAEMAKLLENIFRVVNVALINELALLSERMKIDIWEVIAAASTKPFGFMPFYPGAGVGGHCIPVDPRYLSWKAGQYDFQTRFIDLATDVNDAMPHHAASLVADALNDEGKPVKGSNILVLGVAFKKEIDDTRNSPAEKIISLLLHKGARVRYSDPYVPVFRLDGNDIYPGQVEMRSVELTEEVLRSADCVAIVTGHARVDYARVLKHAPAVVDCCNVTAGIAHSGTKVRRLGSGVTSQAAIEARVRLRGWD